jgi:hypothetical protein
VNWTDVAQNTGEFWNYLCRTWELCLVTIESARPSVGLSACIMFIYELNLKTLFVCHYYYSFSFRVWAHLHPFRAQCFICEAMFWNGIFEHYCFPNTSVHYGQISNYVIFWPTGIRTRKFNTAITPLHHEQLNEVHIIINLFHFIHFTHI